MSGNVDLENKKQVNYVSKVHSGLIGNGKDDDLKEEKMGDHMLQYIVEPILICEQHFTYYSKRRNLSRMEVLKAIRSRVSFFAISNLFDKVELKVGQTELISKL